MGGFYSFFCLKNFSLETILLQSHSETEKKQTDLNISPGIKLPVMGLCRKFSLLLCRIIPLLFPFLITIFFPSLYCTMFSPNYRRMQEEQGIS